jgi:hypothetical protein
MRAVSSGDEIPVSKPVLLNNLELEEPVDFLLKLPVLLGKPGDFLPGYGRSLKRLPQLVLQLTQLAFKCLAG